MLKYKSFIQKCLRVIKLELVFGLQREKGIECKGLKFEIHRVSPINCRNESAEDGKIRGT